MGRGCNRATDSRLGRDVAIKVVAGRWSTTRARSPDSSGKRASSHRSSHPNIVALHDIGTEGHVAFAVMELLDGEPLDRAIGSAGVPWIHALDIAAAIADGLAYAHERGVVHRDLKPPNGFITRDGLVKVLDFGLARQDVHLAVAQTTRAAVPEETLPGVVLGTVGTCRPSR
jgi:serine/threonine protein kinase